MDVSKNLKETMMARKPRYNLVGIPQEEIGVRDQLFLI